ncbi:serine serine/threonine-protein kinase 33 isoform X1 [Solea senegalensis]|uniref:Serine serine/threonine-protein kinase 33 isoform X1 n=3 Tax=Solea senegalensis TaxID=28829 RepID=A0AAV6Q689_SOLSE|nr:serine/threonine-protein kinase 33 isoform X1 [Solea senegalensis]KAG7483047.1 serine serine/threonine-protein kinase 33 isoform X1 [Solea senegalensis]
MKTTCSEKMTEADVSGFVMDVPSPRAGRYPLERDVPVIRLKNDAELREIYEFGKKLGQGSFGVVYETTHIETQTNWAIKKACRPAAGSSKVKMLEQEINILKQVTHAHIVHLKEVYATPRMMYLVTELCTGGDLKQLLRRKKFLTEDETRHIIRALADAIVYLHKRDIVHRDLKLENILVKNPPDEGDNDRINIKVADFGLSVQTGGVGIENIMTEACGTLIYMAPEMMSDRGYTQWCDAWSIGVIMYMLLCGDPPFVSQTKSLLLEEITNREVTFPQSSWATVSDAAKNLLTCLLKVDPAYRMSPNQLLENPWITGDANVPAVPSNVLIMMRNYREEEERTQILENLSLTSSEDTVDPKPLCRSPAKLSPESDSSFYPHTTSTEQTKYSRETCQLDKCTNGSEPWRPRQPTATQQPGAAVKHSVQPGAKQQCRPRHNKDPSPGLKNQKAASYSHRPSTSSKSRTGPRKTQVTFQC